MNYQGAQEARKHMKVPCEIIRVPQGVHFVFIDNPCSVLAGDLSHPTLVMNLYPK
ncbi:hypothetical protein Ddye_007217, partial [Dipteronia dyeriana]